jgi:hypothetical protein
MPAFRTLRPAAFGRLSASLGCGCSPGWWSPSFPRKRECTGCAGCGLVWQVWLQLVQGDAEFFLLFEQFGELDAEVGGFGFYFGEAEG